MRSTLVAACVVALLGVGIAQALEPGSFYTNGPKDKKEIALTFDDGPGTSTDKVLEILKKYNVRATFFMEGDQVEFRGAIAARVHAAGHEIGSHLYSHPDFYHYKKGDPRALMVKEMDQTSELIAKYTNVRPTLLRVPHGYCKQWSRDLSKEKGYVMVNWTFGCDWIKMTPQKLTEVYIKNIKPGAIFLMHDGGKGRQNTLEMLPQLIEAAQKEGYKIVTVSELLNDGAVAVVAEKQKTKK